MDCRRTDGVLPLAPPGRGVLMRGETAASGGERGEPLAWLALDCECECEWHSSRG